MADDPWGFLNTLFGNGFDAGNAMLAMAQNPAMAGAMLDRSGIPVPGGQPGFGQTPDVNSVLGVQPPSPWTPMTGATTPPMMGATNTGLNLQPVPQQSPATPVMPNQGGGANYGPGYNRTLPPQQQPQRIAPPIAPQPQMHGGVTGGAKAPEAQKIQAGQMSGATQALLAALLGGQRQNPLTVPTLGSLIMGH